MRFKMRSRFAVLAVVGVATLLAASAARAQVEEAHLRIDGMT